MSITRLQQARQMYALGQRVGGIMGSNNGSMLVTPTRDGSRPGYYGPDAGHENDPGHGSNSNMGGGGGREGGDGRPNMADIAGPVRGPVDMSHFGDTGDIVQANFTPYNQRPDTITNFFDNYKANVRSNPFNLGVIGAIKTLAQTGKAKELLGFGPTVGPGFTEGDGDGGDNQGIMAMYNPYILPGQGEEVSASQEEEDFKHRFAGLQKTKIDEEGLLNPAIMEMISKLYT